MANITGVKEVKAKLKNLKQYNDRTKLEVIVGYTARYALHVHENKEMKLKGQKRPGKNKGKYWDPQGRAQSKFLETPAREKKNEIAEIVVTTFLRSKKMGLSLLTGGMFLQRESMKIVPVDTGNLKASAFTRYAE